jgi:hypothetical protein
MKILVKIFNIIILQEFDERKIRTWEKNLAFLAGAGENSPLESGRLNFSHEYILFSFIEFLV